MVSRREEEMVRRTVGTLPRRYREAVIFFYFLGQNVGEAAHVLGIPEGTLRYACWSLVVHTRRRTAIVHAVTAAPIIAAVPAADRSSAAAFAG